MFLNIINQQGICTFKLRNIICRKMTRSICNLAFKSKKKKKNLQRRFEILVIRNFLFKLIGLLKLLHNTAMELTMINFCAHRYFQKWYKIICFFIFYGQQVWIQECITWTFIYESLSFPYLPLSLSSMLYKQNVCFDFFILLHVCLFFVTKH